ncbi:hypothetical protein HDV06_005436 [Boothiomyces sp. JEL0866]|nr:hypothetical protein HDV06_005436 [Boothiomyces sp. JEL0866]
MLDYTIILVILGGILVTVQNAQNSTLGNKTTFPFAATVICFLDFVLAIIVWLSYSPSINYQINEIPWYAWFGGPLNMLLIIAVAMAVSKLGLQIVNCCLVSMQMATSVLLDNYGIMVDQRTATLLRLTGLILSIISIILVSFDFDKKHKRNDIEKQIEPSNRTDLYWAAMFICALLSGVSISISGGMLTTFACYTSGTFSSAVGIATGLFPLTLILVYDAIVNGNRVMLSDLKSVPWWAYTGCIFNTYYAIIVAFLVSRFGASTFFGISVVAQIPTGLICDHYGLFGLEKKRIRVSQFAGAVLMVVSIILVSVY